MLNVGATFLEQHICLSVFAAGMGRDHEPYHLLDSVPSPLNLLEFKFPWERVGGLGALAVGRYDTYNISVRCVSQWGMDTEVLCMVKP